eukprot:227591_1
MALALPVVRFSEHGFGHSAPCLCSHAACQNDSLVENFSKIRLNLPRATFWNVKCSCIFSCLPDELLIFGVFKFFDARELSMLRRTCSRWNALAADTVLWESLDLSVAAVPLSPSVHHSFSDWDLTPDCRFDPILGGLLARFGNPMMRVLKLCSRRDVSTESLVKIGRLAPNLCELHLCQVHTVDDSVVNEIAKHCRVLETFSLKGCYKVTSQAVARVLRHSSYMHRLILQNCSALDDSALVDLPAGLRHLNVAGCHRLSDRAAAEVGARAPGLTSLNACGVDFGDAGVNALAEGCPNLVFLHLGSANPFGGSPITDLSARALAANCARIGVLNLQGAAKLTDGALRVLIAALLELSVVHLGGCAKISDAGLLPFADSHRPTTLRQLHLCRLDRLGDGVLATLSRARPLRALSRLDVRGCGRLTEQSISSFTVGFPGLRSLDLGVCRHIPRRAVNVLRQSRPELIVAF